MVEKLIKININVAGRAYPVKITKAEEHIAHSVEKKINAEIQFFQKNYPSMDVRDCLGMAMIKLAFEKEKNVPDEIIDKAQAIKDLIASNT